MIEHGITTTRAEYWMHLFPLLYRVFWYRADQCRAYIKFYKPPLKIGNSNDGTATGHGYLIPQSAYFVQSEIVPRSYLDHVEWRTLTDREAGLRGQEIGLTLIEHRVISFPPFLIRRRDDAESQRAAIDCELCWRVNVGIEIKTECVEFSNLFVQHREGMHRVHLTPNRTTRVTLFDSGFDQ